MIYPFSEGLSAAKLNGKFGYLDHDGNWIISPRYDMAWEFKESRALVTENSKNHFIDRTGRKVADF